MVASGDRVPSAIEVVLMYVPCRDEEEAASLGRRLVEEGLAACANVVGSIRSFFPWEGKLSEEREALLLAKTRVDLLPRVESFLLAHHSYSLPAVLALPVLGVNEGFRRWMKEVLAPPGAAG